MSAPVTVHRWSAAHREGCEYAHCTRCDECESVVGVRMVPQSKTTEPLCAECDAAEQQQSEAA